MTTHAEVRAMHIRQVVDDAEWQRLRESFLGTWKHTPAKNTERLREYLEQATPQDEWLRVRRVLNYLTGTGFRIRIIGCPESDELRVIVRDWWRKGAQK